MEMRICKYCGDEFSIEKFEIANIIKEVEYRRWRCTICQTTSKRDRKHELRKWFDEFKKTLECKICGENRYYMLDLHHRDPEEKDKNLGDVVRAGWSRKRILKEVSKCDTYCANHHRELHWKEK